MHSIDIKHLISVDTVADTPKYLQVSNGVIRAIEKRQLCKGDQLPSIRQLSDQLDISFDTVKKAYDVLKKRNIVVASHGKSNVVNATGPLPAHRIFLLINKLGSHKRIMYEAFSRAFSSCGHIDLYVYNNNIGLFRHLLKNRKPGYTHIVMIPHLADEPAEVREIIRNSVSHEKLVLLDKKLKGLGIPHASIYEDFETDIYQALAGAKEALSKYHTLNIVFPAENYYAPEIRKGFRRFCWDFNFHMEERANFDKHSPILKGEAFITISDEDLAHIIQKARAEGLSIGQDIGIISYNETPLKEVLLDGITTISTDLRRMGELAAEQVLGNLTESIAVPFKLTMRRSL